MNIECRHQRILLCIGASPAVDPALPEHLARKLIAELSDPAELCCNQVVRTRGPWRTRGGLWEGEVEIWTIPVNPTQTRPLEATSHDYR